MPAAKVMPAWVIALAPPAACIEMYAPMCGCDAKDCGPAPGMPGYECPDGSMAAPTGRCLKRTMKPAVGKYGSAPVSYKPAAALVSGLFHQVLIFRHAAGVVNSLDIHKTFFIVCSIKYDYVPATKAKT